jgi:hypothetical protein
MLNTLATFSPVINDPCGRITPIRIPFFNYDYIVVGGKIMDAIIKNIETRLANVRLLLLKS